MTDTVAEKKNGHLGYLLTAYVFDSLSPAGKQEVENHLQSCEACRNELTALQRTLGVLNETFTDNAKEYVFEERRRQRVLYAARNSRLRPSRFSWKRYLWSAAAMVALIAIIAAVAIPSFLRSRSASREVSLMVSATDEARVTTAEFAAPSGAMANKNTEWGYAGPKMPSAPAPSAQPKPEYALGDLSRSQNAPAKPALVAPAAASSPPMPPEPKQAANYADRFTKLKARNILPDQSVVLERENAARARGEKSVTESDLYAAKKDFADLTGGKNGAENELAQKTETRQRGLEHNAPAVNMINGTFGLDPKAPAAVTTPAPSAGPATIVAGISPQYNDYQKNITLRQGNLPTDGTYADSPSGHIVHRQEQLAQKSLGENDLERPSALEKAADSGRDDSLIKLPGLRRAAGGGGGCFLAGTLVQTEQGPLPIESVAPGTNVYACDPSTGAWSLRPTTALLRHEYEGDVITIESGLVQIEATGNHPFWVASGADLAARPAVKDVSTNDAAITATGRWVEARAVRIGDMLVTENGGITGCARVNNTSRRNVRTTVWNITVSQLHTYAVSALGVLVHNKDSVAPNDSDAPVIALGGLGYGETKRPGANAVTGFSVDPLKTTTAESKQEAAQDFKKETQIALELNQRMAAQNKKLPERDAKISAEDNTRTAALQREVAEMEKKIQETSKQMVDQTYDGQIVLSSNTNQFGRQKKAPNGDNNEAGAGKDSNGKSDEKAKEETFALRTTDGRVSADDLIRLRLLEAKNEALERGDKLEAATKGKPLDSGGYTYDPATDKEFKAYAQRGAALEGSDHFETDDSYSLEFESRRKINGSTEAAGKDSFLSSFDGDLDTGRAVNNGREQAKAPVGGIVRKRINLTKLETMLRGYQYFHAQNEKLSFRDYARRPAPVPPPALTDDGLDEDDYIERFGTRPFVDCARDHLSTFGLDVDTASYTLARSRLRQGQLPEPDSVRVEEFLNNFKQPYQVSGDDAFGVFAEGGPSPFNGAQDVEILKIGIKSRDPRPDERKPAMLTFIIDTSGSMSSPCATGSNYDRLDMAREALKALVQQLDGEDAVCIVGFSDQAELVLPRTQARQKQRILDAIDSLTPHGATNVEAGLNMGYRLADEAYNADAVNRVILCSDGVANVGAKGPEEMLKLVKVFSGRGIDLSTVGFGMGQYNDQMMVRLADNGNGSCHFVDTLQQAERIFTEQLPPHLDVLARDAKAQVDFNPDVIERYRLLGYEKRKIADKDFRNDKIDAGEVAHSTLITVLYEIKRKPAGHGPLGKIYLRWKDAGYRHLPVVERNYPLSEGVMSGEVNRATPELRFAACVARFAELLRESPWVRDSSYGAVLEQLYHLPPAFRMREDCREVLELVTLAQSLSVKKCVAEVR